MRRALKIAFVTAMLSPTMAASAFALDPTSIKPHMDVVGEDGAHVGTVDKIEGDQMILTKDDPDAGGVHHRLPITAASNVTNGKVTLRGPAANAKAAWVPVEKPSNDKAK